MHPAHRHSNRQHQEKNTGCHSHNARPYLLLLPPFQLLLRLRQGVHT
jgi:hypothetical protein